MVRVFVNYVDTYTGKAISKLMSKAVVGGISLGDNSDDAHVEASTENVSIQPTKFGDANYVIVGTCSSPNISKLDGVAEIIASEKQDILTALLSCDVIIYHVTGFNSQIEEAQWALESLHGDLASFTSQKVFLCVSSVLTWARSKPLDPVSVP